MPTDPLSLTFAALADPTRRSILTRLADGEATVNELAEPFSVSPPAISRPLKGVGGARPDRPQPGGAVAPEPAAGRPARRGGGVGAVAQADVGGAHGSTRRAPAHEGRAR